MKNRKLIIENIANSPSKSSEKYFINNYIEIYNEIINFSSEIIDISFKERIWFWINNITERPKCKCGEYTKFNGSWNNGNYLRNCSVKCSSNDIIRINNAKKKSLDKWGVDSYTKTNEYKNKKKDILLKKYGVDHYSKTKEYKDKFRNTNIEKYGVDHYSKTNEFKEKIKETSILKYGVDNYAKTEESKEKIRNTSINKYGVDNYAKTDECKIKIKETNLEKYGNQCTLQNEEIKEKSKETNLEKYGVDHYSKTKEYKEKIIKTCLNKYNETSYTKTDECKAKIKETNLEKYGKLSYTMCEQHRKENYKIANNPFYASYVNNNINLFKCDCGLDHKFEILSTTYYSRHSLNLPLCTICYPISKTPSIKELLFKNFIESIYSGKIINSYKDELEIDIYLPELKLGFEFNGLYWHSNKFKDKNYHLNKTNHFKDKGIRIIHIWEDDWIYKNEIIKSQIKNWLNLTNNKIFARKCKIEEVSDNKLVKEFLNKNHIQGFCNNVKKIGLYHNDVLISIMTFNKFEGRKKLEEGEWNLSRFCNKIDTNVIGGASKLLNYFIKKYDPTRIISYADKDWSNGNLYNVLNFKVIHETNPDYKYIINKIRVHKSRYKKSKLNTKLTESEFMREIGIEKIYDCGKIKFELKLKIF